ncbi:branched-chain-amino-acid aminotransferase, cytosolic-like isoform X3 [Callospermophilus lateralis]|uniref:branched-chain-amino-acid aminotransferase, cytosolic-like isoform X3 n=1 Tax=Callospermophilus lateralis TaxID=76772 RepID=UPI004038B907
MKDCSNGCSAEYPGEGGSKQVVETFRAKYLIITPATILKEKPDPNTLVFGTVFTDHMLTVEWSSEFGWEKPHIKPFQNQSLHPGLSTLHYAVELFEATLPLFDKEELLECIQQLVQLDQEWVPYSTSASLYIRPTFIGTEPSLGVKKPTKALLFVILSPVGPYFSSGTFNPVSLWANPKYVRAWKGGTGHCKMGGNYGSSLFAQCETAEKGCQQVLWLYGEDNQIMEVGTVNLFLYWINEDGEEELGTPPLDGIILPGVTRRCILDLVQKWGEFKTIHIPTMENGPKLATRILDKLTDIQYGREESDWTIVLS